MWRRPIVEFNTRPDSVSLTGGQIYTGDTSVDSLLNDQCEDIVRWEFLWVDQSPEETLLSRCLMVIYEDTLSLADVDTLKNDLTSKSSVMKSYSNFYFEPHGSWNDFIDGISKPEDVRDLCAAMARYRQEVFRVLLLDSKHRVLRKVMVCKGGLNAAVVHPREVFAPAIIARAASIILVHNHPSGDPEPSEEDIRLTRRMAEAGQLLGIEVLDHVIMAKGGHGATSKRRC